MVIVVGLGAIFFIIMLVIIFKSYWPSPITNRDLLDYGDINTKMFDTREAAMSEI